MVDSKLADGRGRLLVDLTARVRVLEHPFGHGLIDDLLHHGAGRQLELEQFGVKRRIHLLLIKTEIHD